MKLKKLIQKLFYWDAPGQGAFIHATLALTVPWCLSALLSFAMPLVLMQESGSDVIHVVLWPVLIMFFGMPLVAVFEMLAAAVCLARLFTLCRKIRENGTTRSWAALCLGVLAALCLLSAIVVPLMHGEYWTAYIVPAFALTLLGYGFLGGFLNCLQKGVVGKGVLRAWMAVAAVWLVSLVMAIATKHAADSHCAGVEQRYGRPPSKEARDEWLERDCSLDTAFWKKAGELLQRREKPKNDFESDEEYVRDIVEMDPSRTFSPKELALCRKQLEDFAELPVLEDMFNGAVPCVKIGDFNELQVGETIYEFVHLEQWRLHFALENKNMELVDAVLNRMGRMLECWTELQKHGVLNSGWRIHGVYFRQIRDILASSLPGDELLLRIKESLRDMEAEYKAVLEGVSFCKAVFYNQEFEERDGLFWAGEPRPAIYPLFYFLRTLEGGHWERPVWRRWLQISLGRLLFPQFWFLEANEKRIVFSALEKDSLEIPRYNCGSIMVSMYYELWNYPLYAYRRFLALGRALQCIIDVLLEHRRTGAYPASLPSPLEDPFTGEALKYRVGECWTFDIDDDTPPHKVQAIQIWSCGVNKRDDDGVSFSLRGDGRQRRDDIRIMLPLKQGEH